MSIPKKTESHYGEVLEEEKPGVTSNLLFQVTTKEPETLEEAFFNTQATVVPTTLAEGLFKTPIPIGEEIIYPEQETYMVKEMLKDKDAINLAIKSIATIESPQSMSQMEKEALRNTLALADLFANKGRLEVLHLQVDMEQTKRDAEEIKASDYFKELKEKARLSREARGITSKSDNKPKREEYTRASRLTIDEIEAINKLPQEKKEETVALLSNFIENNRDKGLTEELIVKYRLIIEAVSILVRENMDYDKYIFSITPKGKQHLNFDPEQTKKEAEDIKGTQYYLDIEKQVKAYRAKRETPNNPNT